MRMSSRSKSETDDDYTYIFAMGLTSRYLTILNIYDFYDDITL